MLRKIKKLFHQETMYSDPATIPFILFTAENEVAINHIQLWLSLFQKSHIDFMVVCVNYKAYVVLKEIPQLNVMYIRGKRALFQRAPLFKALKACFYFSNLGRNMYMIDAVPNILVKHIFLGHGDSDKSASAHRFFNIYDEVWTAGEAGIDRFRMRHLAFDHLQFKVIGSPRLKPLMESSKTKQNRAEKILYLPTWEGVYKEQDYSSLSLAPEMLSEIERHFSLGIIIKFHPRTTEDMIDHITKALPQIETYVMQKSIGELLPEGNVYICDISASVSEALVGDRPIFLYYPDNKNIVIAQSKMKLQDYTYLFSNTKELIALLKQVLNGDDYLQKERAKARQYILGERETLNDTFLHSLKMLLTLQPADAYSITVKTEMFHCDQNSFFYCADKSIDKQILKQVATLTDNYRHFYLIVRHKKLYLFLRLLFPKAYVRLIKKERNLEAFLTQHASLKRVIYFSHSAKNLHSLRHSDMKHCLLSNSVTVDRYKTIRVYDTLYTLPLKHRVKL